MQAYNGSSFYASNAGDYHDVISLTVTMAYDGDIVALVAAKQWYYSGGRDWAAQITIDGTEAFYTEGGTGAISDSIALSGRATVAAGRTPSNSAGKAQTARWPCWRAKPLSSPFGGTNEPVCRWHARPDAPPAADRARHRASKSISMMVRLRCRRAGRMADRGGWAKHQRGSALR
jgi:hypothetical protein